MYPHYTYYYPHYLQTKVGWSLTLTSQIRCIIFSNHVKVIFSLITSLFKCHASPCLYALYVYCVTGVVPGSNFEVGGT